MTASLFKVDIKTLKGVGEKKATIFKKLGISSIGDIFYFFPRTFEDLSKVYLIDEAPINENCCIKASVVSPVSKNIYRNGLTVYKAKVSDGFSYMTVTFFNNKYIVNKLKINSEYYFWGKVNALIGAKEMSSPSIYTTDQINKLHPIYPQAENLSSRQIENAIKQAFLLLPDEITDTLPLDIRKKYNLCPLRFALENIHFPKNHEDLNKAKRRLIFEEFLILNLSFKQLKFSITNNNTSTLVISEDYSEDFFRLLSFDLTSSQKKVIDECLNDMKSGKAMNRLIQGDVGCGKTIVAAALAYTVIKENAQVAFMAPTELLAQQHFSYLKDLFKGSTESIDIEVLCGSTSKKEKNRIKDNLMLGNVNIVVGTHALLEDNVIFKNLGLVITDEQHRFGVNQRKRLISKGSTPHIVTMSATPIPRSLALVLYGDLDISTITEMPKYKKPIDTFVIDNQKRESALLFIKKALSLGRQAYIVCPLIEESETLQLTSAIDYTKKLRETSPLKDYSIGLLHGKMNSFEKNEVMQQFLEKKIDVLVSTTVIEVGIDVPNASVIMIENAERLGLSQIHQLRGRVGRGAFKSFCILVSDKLDNDQVCKKLAIISQTNDGFKIADSDLKLRGPGDFFGTRQHGAIKLKSLKLLNDLDILTDVKSAAEDILDDDPLLEKSENRFLKVIISKSTLIN
ncbi:MAG: ATP-dependent DNA helicase RecG [Clostridia bacterium]|nr:ATP-dependent DNA helicase RecG [Clostridia bacterium]